MSSRLVPVVVGASIILALPWVLHHGDPGGRFREAPAQEPAPQPAPPVSRDPGVGLFARVPPAASRPVRIPASVDPATPFQELVSCQARAAAAEDWLESQLSEDELVAMTKTIFELRTAREKLDSLPFDPAHAATRKAIVDSIGSASDRLATIRGNRMRGLKSRPGPGGLTPDQQNERRRVFERFDPK